MTNQDLGLNQYLQPDDSPIANSSGFVSAYTFGSQNDRGAVTSAFLQDASITSAKLGSVQIGTAQIADGAITTAKIADAAITNAKLGTASIGTANIGTLTFGVISGGTATFGGAVNGNGVVSVKDAGGTEHVRLDNTGITVTGGSISILNSSGANTFDSSGLVSSANFSLAASQSGFTGTALQTIASGAFTDITGGSATFTLNRTANVLILGDISWSINLGASNLQQRYQSCITVDGTVEQRAIEELRSISGTDTYGVSGITTESIHYVSSFGSGSHTVKLQALGTTVSGPTASTVTIWDYRLSYVVLGT